MSQSRTGLPWRCDGGIDLDDPPLTAGRGAFVLLVQGSRQDDVGVVAGLREEEVDGRIELEAVERLGGEVGVGSRDGGIEADRDQTLDLPSVYRLDDLLCRDALARDLCLVAAPHRGDVGTVVRVGDVAVPPGSWSHLWPCSLFS